MSTILKALKKVEPQSKQAEKTSLDVEWVGSKRPTPFVSSSTTDQSIRKHRRQRSSLNLKGSFFVVLILLLLLMGMGGWRIFKSETQLPSKKTVTIFPIPKESSERTIATQSADSSITQKSTSSGAEEELAVKPQRSTIKPIPSKPVQPRNDLAKIKNSTKQTPAAIAKKTVDTKKPDPQVKPNVIATSNQSKKAQKPKRSEVPLPAKQPADFAGTENVNAERWKNAQRIENDRMILQALAWSPQPARRMSVIDGLVVREGDDANGFTVVAIQEKNVILTRDRQYYRLEFQGR